MSANVWFEEVNTGLLKELKNTVRIKDANGVLTPADSAKAASDGKSECSTSDVNPKISGKVPVANGTISFDANGTVSGANLEIDGFKGITYSAALGAHRNS